jgi:multidrug efflux pump subunit AcrA (membrane-fusion protein)
MRGGRVMQVHVAEGDPIQQGQRLLDIDSETTNARERITAPIDGVVLERLVEPRSSPRPAAP